MIHSCKVSSVDRQAVVKDDTIRQTINEYSAHAFMQMRKQLSQVAVHKEVRYASFVLPCKRTLTNLFVIPIVINGHKLRFVIDTGAQVSGIKETVAKKLQLSVTSGTLSVGSINGEEKRMKGYLADKLVLGGIVYHHYPMITLRDDDFYIPYTKISVVKMDGIIGWDILHELDFEIDDIAHCFKTIQNRYRFTAPNFISGSFPVVMALDGKNVRYFGIDSGASMSWANQSVLAKNGWKVSGDIATYGMGVHGLVKMEEALVERICVQVDRANIDLRQVMCGRCDIYPNVTIDGIFGNEIFRGRRIRFLNSVQMVLLR